MKTNPESQPTTGCNALAKNHEDGKLPEPLGVSKTIAEIFKEHSRAQLEPLFSSLPRGETAFRHSLRHYDPWPDWVLRIAVEVFSVHLPTVRKQFIYDAFRFVHELIFE